MITRYECPLTGCDWFHDSLDAPFGTWPWKGSIEDSVLASAVDRIATDEQIIAEHFETHPLIMWAREVQAVRERADAAERRLKLFMAVVAQVQGDES